MAKLLLDGKPTSDPFDGGAWVPESVAKCPECGGRLLVEITAWESDTGAVLDDGEGVEVDCSREPDPDDPNYDTRDRHRWWQGEWMPTRDKVEAWAKKHLRVDKEAP